jgi:hypothetical protein
MYKSFNGSNLQCGPPLTRQLSSHYMISYAIVPVCKNLRFSFPDLGLDSLIQFVFCDAREQGVWRDIRSVEVKVWFTGSSRMMGYHFFSQMVGHQQHYEKWWKEFTVTMETAP